jgi:hypothetical protein
MAQMGTTPVYACKHCGAPVVVTLVKSFNDPKAEMLKFIMQGLADIALCPNCRQAELW